MRLLHTADIHLGVTTHGRVDARTGLNSRLLDFKRSFSFMVTRAVDEQVDAFLFAGDAYRTADPTPTEQKIFAECLRPLSEAGIPIIMIVGNHDHPVSYGKASSLDIFSYVTGDVHLFDEPAVRTIETKSGPLQLIALPWPIRGLVLSDEERRKTTPREARALIERRYLRHVQEAVAGLEPALPTVLTAHLTVHGAEPAGSERTSVIAHEPVFDAEQLSLSPIDYVALGHIHRHQNMSETGQTPVVYAGSIERVSFKEWEQEKGFCLVRIDTTGGEKRTSYAFEPTPARPFVALAVDAREAEDPTEHVLAAISDAAITDAVVRVRYQVTEDQLPSVDATSIRRALDEAQIIAAIERVVEPPERRRTSVVRRETSLKEALTQYVAQHEHLAPLKKDLVTAALDIEAEEAADRRG